MVSGCFVMECGIFFDLVFVYVVWEVVELGVILVYFMDEMEFFLYVFV